MEAWSLCCRLWVFIERQERGLSSLRIDWDTLGGNRIWCRPHWCLTLKSDQALGILRYTQWGACKAPCQCLRWCWSRRICLVETLPWVDFRWIELNFHLSLPPNIHLKLVCCARTSWRFFRCSKKLWNGRSLCTDREMHRIKRQLYSCKRVDWNMPRRSSDM